MEPRQLLTERGFGDHIELLLAASLDRLGDR